MSINKKIGNYILGEEIGQGSFATVYIAQRLDQLRSQNNFFAVKCINKEVSLPDCG